MTKQSEIIRVARSWIGTPFHHQGRVKRTPDNKGGCDCLGLVVGVANEVGIDSITSNDRNDYAKNPNGEQLYGEMGRCLKEIPINDMSAGDIALFRFDKDPQHVGIISEKDGVASIIHCYLQARGVVEHSFDKYWKERLVAAFRVC